MGKGTTKDVAPDGHWIETANGRKVELLRCAPERIEIADIAHSLARTCRFVGHTENFYSVAEHSILGSILIEEPYKLAFLLHDAHEAYIGDLSRPLKRIIQGFYPEENNAVIKKVQQRFDALIYNKFYPNIMNLGYDRIGEYYYKIKDFDNAILQVEARTFGFDVDTWNLDEIVSQIDIIEFQDLLEQLNFYQEEVNHAVLSRKYLEYFNKYGGKA